LDVEAILLAVVTAGAAILLVNALKNSGHDEEQCLLPEEELCGQRSR
jgi:hypothetical protein